MCKATQHGGTLTNAGRSGWVERSDNERGCERSRHGGGGGRVASLRAR